MSEEGTRRVPVFEDDRGRLVAVEFDDVAFVPRRMFAVSGLSEGSRRGGHRAGCQEFLVLISGRALVRLDSPGLGARDYELAQPGSSLLVNIDDFVEYELVGPAATLLVLADRPYRDVRPVEE